MHACSNNMEMKDFITKWCYTSLGIPKRHGAMLSVTF